MAIASTADIVGINWGSSNFRAYRIASDGTAVDEYDAPHGIAALDRQGMEGMIADLAAHWPDTGRWIASGMIGSNIGWVSVPYVEAPAGIGEVAAGGHRVSIADRTIMIAPGVACVRAFDGSPDVMRGEEIELGGLVALGFTDGVVALPGTHTKWVRIEGGRIVEFATAMSGEIFDRLTAQGLLASIVEGQAVANDAFARGVEEGRARRFGLGTLLFGARAQVMRDRLAKRDAASYLRGLLIGSEIADTEAFLPGLAQATIPLVGNPAVCALYAAALEQTGYHAESVSSRSACLAGFAALAGCEDDA